MAEVIMGFKSQGIGDDDHDHEGRARANKNSCIDFKLI